MLGDTIIQGTKPKKMQKNLANGKMFLKSFSGATVNQMTHYVKPSLEFNPDIVILHCGTNDLRSDESADVIAQRIIQLANDVKKEDNDVLISGITNRNDKYRSKCIMVNETLKTLCHENLYEFIDNSNINLKQHISPDGLT